MAYFSCKTQVTDTERIKGFPVQINLHRETVK